MKRLKQVNQVHRLFLELYFALLWYHTCVSRYIGILSGVHLLSYPAECAKVCFLTSSIADSLVVLLTNGKIIFLLPFHTFEIELLSLHKLPVGIAYISTALIHIYIHPKTTLWVLQPYTYICMYLYWEILTLQQLIGFRANCMFILKLYFEYRIYSFSTCVYYLLHVIITETSFLAYIFIF